MGNINIIEVAETVTDYIEKLNNGIDKVIEDLRSDKVDSVFLEQVFEGLDWTIEAVYALENNEFICTNVSIEELNRKLNELLEGMKNEDYILVSDILEYEMKDLLNVWNSKIQKEINKEK